MSAVYFPIISFSLFLVGSSLHWLDFFAILFSGSSDFSHFFTQFFFTINARAPNLIYLVGGLFGPFFKVFKGVLKVVYSDLSEHQNRLTCVYVLATVVSAPTNQKKK